MRVSQLSLGRQARQLRPALAGGHSRPGIRPVHQAVADIDVVHLEHADSSFLSLLTGSHILVCVHDHALAAAIHGCLA